MHHNKLLQRKTFIVHQHSWTSSTGSSSLQYSLSHATWTTDENINVLCFTASRTYCLQLLFNNWTTSYDR